MSEYLLESATAHGKYFVDVVESSAGEKPMIRLTDYPPLAAAFSSKDGALEEAAKLPGGWLVRRDADIPPRILK